MIVSLIVSLVGHVGVLLFIYFLAQTMGSPPPPMQGAIVPIEIVDTAAESNVQALAIPNDEGDLPQTDQTQLAANDPIPRPAAVPVPQPHRMTAAEEQEQMLRDLARQQGHRRTNGTQSDRNQDAVGPGTRNVVALQDRVRSLIAAQMRRCWREPADLPNPERLVVTVQFELDRNGNLRGQPRVTAPANYQFDHDMNTAANSALRAIRACDPFETIANDPLVGSHFDVWREQEYTFRPSGG